MAASAACRRGSPRDRWEPVAAELAQEVGGVRRRAARARCRRRTDDHDRLAAAPARVAEFAADGLTNAEIARRCDVSVDTVERHLRQVYRTLGISPPG